jgi:hypothetical protein
MNVMLDVGVVVGFFLVLLKAADLVFLPHQQDAIHKYFEDLTLWFDDIEIEELSERTNEQSIQIVMILCGWFVSLAIACTSAISTYLLFSGAHDIFINLVVYYLIGLLLSIILIIPLWQFGYRTVALWISHSHSRLIVSLKAAVIIFPSVGLFMFLFIVILEANLFDLEQLGHRNIALIAALYMPVTALFLTTGITVVVGQLLFDIANGRRSIVVRFFLAIGKGVLWRIVLFQKGAVGAVVLIITIFLSILKLAL